MTDHYKKLKAMWPWYQGAMLCGMVGVAGVMIDGAFRHIDPSESWLVIAGFGGMLFCGFAMMIAGMVSGND